MTTFGRVCLDYLTPKQKQYKWCAINLIKEKWCVKIKVIACADCRLKISYITKEEVASPTVWMELLLPQLMIDVFEERKMKIFDVPGAYLMLTCQNKNMYCWNWRGFCVNNVQSKTIIKTTCLKGIQYKGTIFNIIEITVWMYWVRLAVVQPI